VSGAFSVTRPNLSMIMPLAMPPSSHIVCRPVPTSTLFESVHEPLVTLVANAANLASSLSAALSNARFGSTTISDDGLT
jgi:hypothetical protein